MATATPNKTTIFLRNFVGKTIPMEVDLDTKVAEVRRQAAKTSLRAGSSLEPVLKYNGHELRSERPLSFYGVAEKSPLHILPPRKSTEKLLNLTCIHSGRTFFIEVDPKLTVAQLKKDIELEEKIEVHSLGYHNQISDSADDDEEEWEVVPAATNLVLLEPDDAVLSTFAIFAPSDESGGRAFTVPPVIHVLPHPPPLVPPETFPVTIALYDDGTEKKLSFDARLQMTLNEFREAVKEKCGVSLEQDALILVGKELNPEEVGDIPIWDLGFVPKCTIHSVPYISFDVEVLDLKTFGPFLLHPLTKLSEIRKILEQTQRDQEEAAKATAASSSSTAKTTTAATQPEEGGEKEKGVEGEYENLNASIPLEYYDFTLDGDTPLKEWRTLWGLGAVSGSTIYLKPHHNVVLKIYKAGFPEKLYNVPSDVDDTIADIKLRFEVMANISLKERVTHLFHRGYKLLSDKKTVKEEGLEGGETLVYGLREGKSSKYGQDSDDNEALDRGYDEPTPVPPPGYPMDVDGPLEGPSSSRTVDAS